MKKILFIIIGILIVIGITFLLYSLYKKPITVNSPSTEQPSTDMPSIEDMKKDGEIELPTSEGSVSINNPYAEASTVVAGNAAVKETSEYAIVYLGDLKSFVITIYGKQMNGARRQAEQAFLDSLGVSKDDACKLDVSLSIDKEADEDAAGQEFGLSFCPNGKAFPSQ